MWMFFKRIKSFHNKIFKIIYIFVLFCFVLLKVGRVIINLPNNLLGKKTPSWYRRAFILSRRRLYNLLAEKCRWRRRRRSAGRPYRVYVLAYKYIMYGIMIRLPHTWSVGEIIFITFPRRSHAVRISALTRYTTDDNHIALFSISILFI